MAHVHVLGRGVPVVRLVSGARSGGSLQQHPMARAPQTRLGSGDVCKSSRIGYA